ncbi:MAG: methionine--tRNA ligase, partial [Pseudobdellovibrionaceae bacterium]
MSTTKRTILMTGALPYANGPIHIGHLVEYIQADIWSRFQKMRGHDCTFVCADDTHGTPIMIKARELGVRPEDYVAQSQKEHMQDFADFEIAFDHYSSTNSEENKQLCEDIFTKLKANGLITVRTIDQLYSEQDKMFLPDRFIKGTCPKCGEPDQYGDACDKCGATYSPTEMKDPRSAVSGAPLTLKPSEHIFFTLNKKRDFLINWIPKHTDSEVSNKQMEWFKEDLRDWDISRDEPYFGFEIPGHPKKYFYVWVDAPIGYVSSSWQWLKKNGRNLDDYWKAGHATADKTEIYHFIGKDIAYFHTLFWP